MERFRNIWKNNEDVRKQYNNDFELYIEAMQLYLDACDEINQVS
jgi:hypothetical protein